MEIEWIKSDIGKKGEVREITIFHLNFCWSPTRRLGSQMEDMLVRILNEIEASNSVLHEMKSGFSQLSQMVTSHLALIKHLETWLKTLLPHINN